jgi:hypothetical protein
MVKLSDEILLGDRGGERIGGEGSPDEGGPFYVMIENIIPIPR